MLLGQIKGRLTRFRTAQGKKEETFQEWSHIQSAGSLASSIIEVKEMVILRANLKEFMELVPQGIGLKMDSDCQAKPFRLHLFLLLSFDAAIEDSGSPFLRYLCYHGVKSASQTEHISICFSPFHLSLPPPCFCLFVSLLLLSLLSSSRSAPM